MSKNKSISKKVWDRLTPEQQRSVFNMTEALLRGQKVETAESKKVLDDIKEVHKKIK